MDAKFKAKNPDDIKLELTVCMTLSAWKNLKESLTGIQYQQNGLYSQINKMVDFAEKHFESEKED